MLEKRYLIHNWYATQSQSLLKSPETENNRPITPRSIFPSDPELKKIFDFIEANYHRQITLNDLAQAVGYSRTYLSKLVRCQTGQTVQSWIIQRRMTATRFLLVETSERVQHIAALVGYQHPVHFFRQFRQYHGTTPQVWRKEHSSYIPHSET